MSISNNTRFFLRDGGSISNSFDHGDSKYKYPYSYENSLFISIIIVVFSPVAVVGNALILTAIWKKTFQRTPFHILLSGLSVTDLCTGLITQPFDAAGSFLDYTNFKECVKTSACSPNSNNWPFQCHILHCRHLIYYNTNVS